MGSVLPYAARGMSAMYNKFRDFVPKANPKTALINMSVDELTSRLQKIKPERYKDVTPQTGLTSEEYANIVQKQANELGVRIAKGNPELVNSGVMHFVLDKNTGKVSNRAPFVGTLKNTYTNPDITITNGDDKNYIRLLNDTTLRKSKIDNLVTRNDELYSKYQIRLKQLADKIKRSETDNLSISQDILNDMGISPSLEYADNIAPNGANVKSNQANWQELSRNINPFTRRGMWETLSGLNRLANEYSVEQLTPYLVPTLANNR